MMIGIAIPNADQCTGMALVVVSSPGAQKPRYENTLMSRPVVILASLLATTSRHESDKYGSSGSSTSFVIKIAACGENLILAFVLYNIIYSLQVLFTSEDLRSVSSVDFDLLKLT